MDHYPKTCKLINTFHTGNQYSNKNQAPVIPTVAADLLCVAGINATTST